MKNNSKEMPARDLWKVHLLFSRFRLLRRSCTINIFMYIYIYISLYIPTQFRIEIFSNKLPSNGLCVLLLFLSS